MPRHSGHPKTESVNFRVPTDLKAAFTAATEADDKPAAQVLRDFMRAYVSLRRRRARASEAHRQSLVVAAAAADYNSGEALIMREIEAELRADDFHNEWR